ncbi:MAG: hypothetical protein GY729_19475 [Desulfobacteraceae bacterium]|nr:hypothetical protein [Desulfobacteraceae bacterium]
MKTQSCVILLLLLALAGCVASTSSEPYNQKTIATINGTVTGIDTVVNANTNEPGNHIIVNSGKGLYTVHVCPDWYAQKNTIKFSIGDIIQVTGSTFTRNNEKNIYAAKIIDKSGRVIELRNLDTGKTLWGGRQRDDSSSPGFKEEEMKNKNKKGDGTIGSGKGNNGPKKDFKK